jgi:lipopolysaccharide transport system ATP-binding protein
MGHVRVSRLGKAYKRYAHKSGRLREWLGLGLHHELVWVLRDVNLEVLPGEAVGIVGANGAGKSTLLKMVTGTVTPTTGKVEVAGRIASLLELGIGFDPNFTGRQNAMMTSALLGLPSGKLAALLPEIEAFAEIGDYMDQPLRTYSTGMQIRLAFSVATARRPDVLIVDEALSVGDAYFQHKSFDRIRHFRDEGTTLLLVSHSAAAVKTLCNRAVLLDHGVLLRDDVPDAVLDYYNALIAKQCAEHEIRQSESAAGTTTTRSGNARAVITRIELLSRGQSVRALRSGDPATVTVQIEVRDALPELTAGILFRDRLGNDVFGTNTFHLGANRASVAAGAILTVEFVFPSLDLGVGSYSLTAALHAQDTHVAENFDWWDRALVLQIVPGDRPMSIGVAALRVAVSWFDSPPSPDRSAFTRQAIKE